MLLLQLTDLLEFNETGAPHIKQVQKYQIQEFSFISFLINKLHLRKEKQVKERLLSEQLC